MGSPLSTAWNRSNLALTGAQLASSRVRSTVASWARRTVLLGR
jgi:hypothetical protein